MTADKGHNNYLRFEPSANCLSVQDFGVKILMEYGEEQQFAEMHPVRGYMSSSERAIHFGLGMNSIVDKITIDWPNGGQQILTDVKANQVILLNPSEISGQTVRKSEKALFQNLLEKAAIDFKHKENEFDDYTREILIPHKMSTLGPCIAKADVNGDGREDFYVGAPIGQSGELYIQDRNGNFSAFAQKAPWKSDAESEDVDAEFFDADGDGDMDLIVASGGNEYLKGDRNYQDRIYLNEGGNWRKAGRNVFSAPSESSGVVRTGDIDGDGDKDLFIGGRQIPGQYGFAASSYVYRNEGGRFTDVTREVSQELKDYGMVTDAIWHDVDGDSDMDLLTCGEWMPISYLENVDGKLVNRTEEIGMSGSTGWWNVMELVDIDGDGSKELVCGNLGKNIKYKASKEEPFKLFAKDFDDNGTHDVYLGYYDHDGVCYPVRGRQCSSDQMPFIKEKFTSYGTFSKATIEDVLSDRLEGAVVHEARMFSSVWIDLSNWQVTELPSEAQISPIYGIVGKDWTGDGEMDLLVGGNYHNREVETTRSDAGIGRLLVGDGEGGIPIRRHSEDRSDDEWRCARSEDDRDEERRLGSGGK